MSCTTRRIPAFVDSLARPAHSPSVTRSPERADSALTWTARVPTLAVFLAAAIVPFEVPLLQLGAGVTVTTVELACLLAVGATLAAHAAAGRPVRWRTPITWAALSCLLV